MNKCGIEFSYFGRYVKIICYLTIRTCHCADTDYPSTQASVQYTILPTDRFGSGMCKGKHYIKILYSSFYFIVTYYHFPCLLFKRHSYILSYTRIQCYERFLATMHTFSRVTVASTKWTN